MVARVLHNRVNLSRLIATLGFVTLFPLYALYHLGVSSALFPPIWGGLHSYTVIVILALFVPILISKTADAKLRINMFLLCVGFMFAFNSLWVLSQYLLNEGLGVSVATFQILNTMASWAALLMVGIFLPTASKSLRWTMGAAFTLLSAIIIVTALATGSTSYYTSPVFHARQDAVTYQGIARSYLVVSIFLLSTSDSVRARVILTIISLPTLFLIGARSELLAFMAAALVLWYLWSKGRLTNIIALTLLAGGLSLLLIAAPSFLGQSRQLELFNLQESSSWSARERLLDEGVAALAASPLSGNFTWHVSSDGSAGNYIHNALSAFMVFGALGGVLYLSLIVLAFGISARRVLMLRDRDHTAMFSFCINLISILLVLTTKSVYWIIPGLGWGLCLNVMYASRNTVSGLNHRLPIRKCNSAASAPGTTPL